MPSALLAIAMLTGCRGLAGTWTGTLLCLGDAEILEGDATLALVDDRGGEVGGELRVEGDYSSPTLRGQLLLSWELELERTRLAGEQDLDHLLDECSLWVDGALAGETCPDGDALRFFWDGKGLLTMDGGGCDAQLLR